MNRQKTLTMIYYAIFIAIIFLLGMTPLGFLVLPFLPIAGITTVHIPVIVGSYHFDVKGGAILGFFFGLTSFIRCFTTPDLVATIVLGTNTGFGVYNLLLIVVIIFLPRVLTGVFSALVYRWISKPRAVKGGTFGKIYNWFVKWCSEAVAMAAAAIVGSMTNTVFFLGGLAVLAYKDMMIAYDVTSARGLIAAIMGVVGVNGVAEAIAAALVCTAVGKALSVYRKHAK